MTLTDQVAAKRNDTAMQIVVVVALAGVSFAGGYAWLAQNWAAAMLCATLAVGIGLASLLRFGLFFTGRAVAAAQGFVWFIALSHGGLGLLFGPIGWISSAVAHRLRFLAAGLLVLPAIFLTVSYAAPLSRGSLADTIFWFVLVAPALLGSAVFLTARR